MRNFIKSNYNIYPKKIYKKDNKYFFFSNNEKIYILKVKKDKDYIDRIINISNDIYRYNTNISTFLLNVEGKFYTKKDDYYIVLLKYNDVNDNIISIKDIDSITSFNNINIEKYNVIKKFEEEIDTLEKEMLEYNKEYPNIQKSINYFIGLSENGIQLLKTIELTENTLCHDIGVDNFNRYEFNNPFNIIRTNKMYDYVNYFKYSFYNSSIDYEELYAFLNNNKNNYENLVSFFGMLLFQKEYFDCTKDILLNKRKECDLNIYINKINDYYKLLKYIKDNLSNVKEIQQIEWLDE